MIISLIAAIGKNRELGRDNKMLWHISKDFKNFKRLTMGHCMVMGRKTFESIGRVLPGRTTIVLTQNKQWFFKNVVKAAGLKESLQIAKEHSETELFVVGGAEIYRLFLPLCSTMYLSKVDFSGKADTYFPEFNEEDWELSETTNYKAQGEVPSWSFEVLKKIRFR